MPKMDECKIDVELALAIRELAARMRLDFPKVFRCVECNELLEPHSAAIGSDGVEHAAHFEHVRKNPACKLGHSYEKGASAS